MNYTDILSTLQHATLFDLFRLTLAISHEMENPDRIKKARSAFKVGDSVSFFDQSANALKKGKVLEKNIKYVSLLEENSFARWKLPYCYLNIDGVNTDIEHQPNEKLSKNNLKIGDCVGFNHDGEHITGVVTRLNYKSVSMVTANRRRWRVGYGCLYKIIDAELAERFAELSGLVEM